MAASPLLHGDDVVFGWDDWPWVAGFVAVLGLFWLVLLRLWKRSRDRGSR